MLLECSKIKYICEWAPLMLVKLFKLNLTMLNILTHKNLNYDAFKVLIKLYIPIKYLVSKLSD